VSTANRSPSNCTSNGLPGSIAPAAQAWDELVELGLLRAGAGMVVEGVAKRDRCRQPAGKLPCCHPMLDDVTGPGVGVDASAGAVHAERWVWAPYQVADPADFDANQHVPLVEWLASVTVPLSAPTPFAPAASAPPMTAPPAPPTLLGPPPAAPPPLAPPPAPVNATLMVDGLDVGPATNEIEGSEVDSEAMSSAP
jgi:hypothetical protein